MANPKLKQVIAEVDPALVVALRKTLLDEGLTYKEWVEKTMRAFVDPKYLPKRPRLPRHHPKPRWQVEQEERRQKAEEAKT